MPGDLPLTRQRSHRCFFTRTSLCDRFLFLSKRNNQTLHLFEHSIPSEQSPFFCYLQLFSYYYYFNLNMFCSLVKIWLFGLEKFWVLKVNISLFRRSVKIVCYSNQTVFYILKNILKMFSNEICTGCCFYRAIYGEMIDALAFVFIFLCTCGSHGALVALYI